MRGALRLLKDPPRLAARVGVEFTEHRERLINRLVDLRLIPSQTDYTPYLIVASGRTGTNLLLGALNSHPNIIGFYEIFHNFEGAIAFRHPGYRRKTNDPALLRLKHEDPVRLIEQEVYKPYRKYIRAAGFKILYHQMLEEPECIVREYLQQRMDLKILHLKRLNLLRAVLSGQLAKARGEWFVRTGRGDGSSKAPPGAITIPYEFCLQRFEWITRRTEEEDRNFSQHDKIELIYEQLSTNFTEEMFRVQRFLDVPEIELSPRTEKMTKTGPRDMILNYDELKEKFEGTRWSRFFED